MYKLQITGRIGSDAKTGTSKSGKPYVNFSVASTVWDGTQEQTKWTSVFLIGDRKVNPNFTKLLTKGSVVMASGEPRHDVGENGEIRTTITAFDFELLHSKQAEGNAATSNDATNGNVNDDLPF